MSGIPAHIEIIAGAQQPDITHLFREKKIYHQYDGKKYQIIHRVEQHNTPQTWNRIRKSAVFTLRVSHNKNKMM